MPHISIEYSINLEQAIAPARLVEVVHQAALNAGVFATSRVPRPTPRRIRRSLSGSRPRIRYSIRVTWHGGQPCRKRRAPARGSAAGWPASVLSTFCGLRAPATTLQREALRHQGPRAREEPIDDRIINIMTKVSVSAAYEQVLMLSLRILAQQFCGLAARAERRLS